MLSRFPRARAKVDWPASFWIRTLTVAVLIRRYRDVDQNQRGIKKRCPHSLSFAVVMAGYLLERDIGQLVMVADEDIVINEVIRHTDNK